MKKLLLPAICLAFALYSCADKTVAPTTGISAIIDGKAETFNTIDSAVYAHRDSVYALSISAKTSAADTADKIQLNLFTKTPVTPGTYTLAADYHPPYGPLIVYKVKGSSNFLNDYIIDYTGAHQIAIVVTSISTTNVQGTFNGTLIEAAGPGPAKTIVDGKFNVDVK